MVWKGIIAGKRHSKPFVYLKRTEIKKAGGKGSFHYTETADVPLVFIPESYSLVMDADGNTNQSTAEAVIPSKFFTDNSLTPSVNDRLMDENGIKYRIINIADFRIQPHSRVYHIYLRRDELAN